MMKSFHSKCTFGQRCRKSESVCVCVSECSMCVPSGNFQSPLSIKLAQTSWFLCPGLLSIAFYHLSQTTSALSLYMVVGCHTGTHWLCILTCWSPECALHTCSQCDTCLAPLPGRSDCHLCTWWREAFILVHRQISFYSCTPTSFGLWETSAHVSPLSTSTRCSGASLLQEAGVVSFKWTYLLEPT